MPKKRPGRPRKPKAPPNRKDPQRSPTTYKPDLVPNTSSPVFPFRQYKRSALKVLTKAFPDLYRHLMLLVSQGVHPVVAGAAIGIPPDAIRSWINKGQQAVSGLYRQFWDDLVLQIAATTADASIEIRLKSPEKWLQSGSALDVFDPSELPVPSFQTQQASNNITNNTLNVLNPETIPILADALLELKRFGITLDSEPKDYIPPPPEEEEDSSSPKP